MGTDIHLGLEQFTGSEWLPVNREDWLTDFWDFDQDSEEYKKAREENPRNRDYGVFGFLAGVRNGFGFAGHKRNDPFDPLFANRGIPDDTSFRFNSHEDFWLCPEDHSHTYFSLKEAMKADWGIAVRHYGYTPLLLWKEWKDSGADTPSMWCLSGSFEKISEDEAQSRVDKGMPLGQFMGDSYDSRYDGDWVQCSFVYKPLLKSSFRRWLLSEKMKNLAEKHGSENLRICMSFDC